MAYSGYNWVSDPAGVGYEDWATKQVSVPVKDRLLNCKVRVHRSLQKAEERLRSNTKLQQMAIDEFQGRLDTLNSALSLLTKESLTLEEVQSLFIAVEGWYI
jgi:hypothetical protein